MVQAKSTPVICGFSATLKSTLAKRLFPGRKYIDSPTKIMSNTDYEYFKWSSGINPYHYISARMWLFKQFMDMQLVVERSLYDFIFYAVNFNDIPGLRYVEDIDVSGLDKMEEELLGNREYYLIKNEAINFLQDRVVNRERNRSKIYTNIDAYLQCQDLYINFLSKFITPKEVIVLTDNNIYDYIND